MILTISTTHKPATDLGFLLMKHPDNVHQKSMPFGVATLFYPEATEERCTAALMLEVDPVGLVRGFGDKAGTSLFTHYVTDRPFAVTSFMSVAITRLLRTAMSGKSRAKQELAEQEIPLEVTLSPLPSRGGVSILTRLFEPLGYEVAAEPAELDATQPDWGDSVYYRVTLKGTKRLADLLTHLFVLIPVLDNQKHYWVGEDEVEKLLAKGEGWLENHPEQELIAKRYLKHRKGLVLSAMEQLSEGDDEALSGEGREDSEEALEKPLRLNDVRMETMVTTLKNLGAQSVVDLGCGEGKLLRLLMKEPSFKRILGVDVSSVALDRAAQRLYLDKMTPRQRERINIVQGSLVYIDDRIKGFDAAACVEVIEHMELDRLPAFEQAVFAEARPKHVLVSTPNREYNVLFENMPEGKLRHNDHRFEWTRAEFQDWANGVAEKHGYSVRFEDIGTVHEEHGAPTQMGVFSR